MLSAKIKDEPVNQMVSCKSSFAFEERDEERRCRELETFRYRAPMCPAGAMGWRQRGRPREQQVYLGSVWGLPTAQQGEEWSARVSLEDARVRSRLCSPCTCENTVRVFPGSWRLPRNGAKQGDARVALGTQICSVDLPWRARSPAGPASVSLLTRRRGHPPPQAAAVSCSTLFSPHWAHLCRAAVAETLKLHLQGRQELWGGLRNLEVGLWEPSPTDPGRQQPQSARLQLFAKAS